MVNFPTWIPKCDSHSPALLVDFFLLTLVFVRQWLSVQREIQIMLPQFPLTFCQTQKEIILWHTHIRFYYKENIFFIFYLTFLVRFNTNNKSHFLTYMLTRA